jgi:hypothetical protein
MNIKEKGEAVLRIRDIYSGSGFFHPGSRIQGQKESVFRIRIHIKEYVYPGSEFFLPGSMVKNIPDFRSGPKNSCIF